MYKQTAALVFGFLFIALGILGYVPGVTTPEGMLFGIFHVNGAHNIVHIISGLFALAAYFTGPETSGVYFRIFGVVYALLALTGFYSGESNILGIVANNPAASWLHTLVAIVSLYIGFVAHELPTETPTGTAGLREAYRHY